MNPIPNNLAECFEILVKDFAKGSLEQFKNTVPDTDMFISVYHMTIGLNIRNEWGLWVGRNKLVQYFHNLGIYHPDDMSSIIITSFHRFLNNKPIQLEKQVTGYRKYWKALGYKDGNPCKER